MKKKNYKNSEEKILFLQSPLNVSASITIVCLVSNACHWSFFDDIVESTFGRILYKENLLNKIIIQYNSFTLIIRFSRSVCVWFFIWIDKLISSIKVHMILKFQLKIKDLLGFNISRLNRIQSWSLTLKYAHLKKQTNSIELFHFSFKFYFNAAGNIASKIDHHCSVR